jgi:hypothetical protein
MDPTPLDPRIIEGAVTIAGLKYLGKPSAELVKDFLGRILAPSGDAFGQVLAHPIVEWQKRRVERADKLVERAAAIAAERGEEPKPVPGRILFNILEHGSVEEDNDLAEPWAALLANASTRPSTVLPAFASILAELSPLEARLLMKVQSVVSEIAKVNSSIRGLPTEETNAQATELMSQLMMPQLGAFLELSETDVALRCDNLERLKLLGASADPTSDYMPVVFVRSARLSAFGAAFIDACTTDR